MPTDRAPRNAKSLLPKVRALIADFPLQKQLEVATWLSGQVRTNIIPALRAEAKAAAKTNGSTARSGAKRPTVSNAKRRLAGQKAAATRKARGTQRGGRRPRTIAETANGIDAGIAAAA